MDSPGRQRRHGLSRRQWGRMSNPRDVLNFEEVEVGTIRNIFLYPFSLFHIYISWIFLEIRNHDVDLGHANVPFFTLPGLAGNSMAKRKNWSNCHLSTFPASKSHGIPGYSLHFTMFQNKHPPGGGREFIPTATRLGGRFTQRRNDKWRVAQKKPWPPRCQGRWQYPHHEKLAFRSQKVEFDSAKMMMCMDVLWISQIPRLDSGFIKGENRGESTGN